jgi:Fe2+ transport system protein FeoA
LLSNCPESVQNHLMHMGFVPDALVTALRRAPAGDPTVYAIDGMEIALRHETAEAIRVRPAVRLPDDLIPFRRTIRRSKSILPNCLRPCDERLLRNPGVCSPAARPSPDRSRP